MTAQVSRVLDLHGARLVRLGRRVALPAALVIGGAACLGRGLDIKADVTPAPYVVLLIIGGAAVVASYTVLHPKQRARRRAQRQATEGGSMQLTDDQRQTDREMIARVNKVWPDFCRAIGLTEPDPAATALAAGLATMSIFGRRRGRLLAGGGRAATAFLTDGERAPRIIGVWPSALGPALGIDAAWIARDDLAREMPLLAQHLGVDRCEVAYVAAAETPTGRALLVITVVTREPVREIRRAGWIADAAPAALTNAASGPHEVSGPAWYDAIEREGDANASDD